jgi:hypothetical protein
VPGGKRHWRLVLRRGGNKRCAVKGWFLPPIVIPLAGVVAVPAYGLPRRLL